MARISPTLLLLLIIADWTVAFGFVVKASKSQQIWPPVLASRGKVTVMLGGRSRSRSSNNHHQRSAHSFVEGSSFESQIEEIEAMGGAPFFFTPTKDGNTDELTDSPQSSDATGSRTTEDDEGLVPTSFLSSSFLNTIDSVVDAISLVEERYSTDGKGPTPSNQNYGTKKTVEQLALEWDGTVDDDAHLGLD